MVDLSKIQSPESDKEVDSSSSKVKIDLSMAGQAVKDIGRLDKVLEAAGLNASKSSFNIAKQLADQDMVTKYGVTSSIAQVAAEMQDKYQGIGALHASKQHDYIKDVGLSSIAKELLEKNTLRNLELGSIAQKATEEQEKLSKMFASSYANDTANFSNTHKVWNPSESIKNFTPPPNPIHKTNEKLDALRNSSIATNNLLNEYISTSSGLLQTLNDSIRRISTDSAEDASKARIQNRWAIIIAVVSTLLSTAGIGYSIWKDAHDISLSELQKSLVRQEHQNDKLLEQNDKLLQEVIMLQQEIAQQTKNMTSLLPHKIAAPSMPTKK